MSRVADRPSRRFDRWDGRHKNQRFKLIPMINCELIRMVNAMGVAMKKAALFALSTVSIVAGGASPALSATQMISGIVQTEASTWLGIDPFQYVIATDNGTLATSSTPAALSGAYIPSRYWWGDEGEGSAENNVKVSAVWNSPDQGSLTITMNPEIRPYQNNLAWTQYVSEWIYTFNSSTSPSFFFGQIETNYAAQFSGLPVSTSLDFSISNNVGNPGLINQWSSVGVAPSYAGHVFGFNYFMPASRRGIQYEARLRVFQQISGPTIGRPATVTMNWGIGELIKGKSARSMAATTSAVVPEPSTWMLMILGFGLIAQQLRRRHLPAGAA